MRWLWRALLFNGNDRFVLLILAWLVRFLLGQDLRLTACQKHLDGFSQIFDYVKPVCALDGLGSACSHGGGIFSSSITTHHCEIRLLVHPPCCGFRLPIRYYEGLLEVLSTLKRLFSSL